MLPRESKKYLWDAQHAADLVLGFAEGRIYEDYQTNDMLRSAVERQPEIVGEALAQFARRNPNAALLIPELHAVVGLRNVLAHGYETVDNRRIWSVVQEDLPGLRVVLARLLGEPN